MRRPVLEVLDAVRVDASAGKCFWRHPPNRRLVGKKAGYAQLQKSGWDKQYWRVRYMGQWYKRCHLVFASIYGRWPSIIDHINGNTLDDRIINLREVTPQQNKWNQRTHRKRSPLPRGIRVTNGGKFQVRIQKDGRVIYGTFTGLAEANAFYLKRRKELFQEYSGL